MNNSSLAHRVFATPGSLTVEWSDGRSSEFLSVWLRDNRPADRDAFSGQRLIDVLDLPLEPRIHSVAVESEIGRAHV